MKKITFLKINLILSMMITGLFAIRAKMDAIEIPLDGFGKGTTIAYVNMHKIFEAYPETEKARVELTDIIDKKKAEITAMREGIAQLKSEVSYLKKQFSAVSPSKNSQSLVDKQKETETTLDQTTVEGSTTILTLPEKSPLKFLFEPKENSTDTTFGGSPEYRYSTFTVQSPQILPGVPSPAPKLNEIEAELQQKESDLAAFVGAAESEIKRLQEGKTMTLMAKIYRSLEDIAKNDGYTIIVDKENILYGENTVDITESVIWRLTSPKNRR